MIDQARDLGLTFTVVDGAISVHGQRTPAVTALLEQLKPHKVALLAALQPNLEFGLDDVDALPIEPPPPMIIGGDRPPLPTEMWLEGLTPSAALSAWQELKQIYFCSCGKNTNGWYVRCDPSHYKHTL